MRQPLPIKIVGTGMYAPPRVQTAEDLSPLLGRSARWIRSRSGVGERRICEEPVEQMAASAAKIALGDGPPPDLVISASLTPVQLIPDNSIFVQQALGTTGIPSFSIHATCLSFLVGLQQASAQVSTGFYERVLVVSAEQGSRCRDFKEPESASLIGDGAGAAVVERAPEGGTSALLAWSMSTDPANAHLAQITGCGMRRFPTDPDVGLHDYQFHMAGAKLYRHAFRHVSAMLKDLFEGTGLSREDVDVVVPHQASGPALLAVQKLGFPRAQVVDIIGKYGNCIAASIPMALAVADAEGRLKRGDLVLLMGTGAGLSVAGALVRW